MAKLYNLSRMTTATTGTGTITLGSAVAGYLTFSQGGIADGDVIAYGIKDGTSSEVGTGTYTASGTTLTRIVGKSTNSNSALNLSGNAEVYITARAEDFVSFAALAAGNMALNSGHLVSQESGDNSITVNASGGGTGFNLDDNNRCYMQGTYTASYQRVTDAPPGFLHSLKLTINSAEASMGANDVIHRFQKIEGGRIAQLAQGGANAQACTIGWWLKPSVNNQVVSLFVANAAEDRNYLHLFTLPASVWTWCTVTIPGCPNGTWNTDNTIGMIVGLNLGCGSTYFGTADTWQTGSLLDGTSGVTNMAATNGATFQDVGPFVLFGTDTPSSLISPALVRPYEVELALCRRHYWRRASVSGNEYLAIVQCYTTSNAFGFMWRHPSVMRANPSMSVSAAAHFSLSQANVGANALTSVGAWNADLEGFAQDGGFAVSGTPLVAGNAAQFRFGSASGWIAADARL